MMHLKLGRLTFFLTQIIQKEKKNRKKKSLNEAFNSFKSLTSSLPTYQSLSLPPRTTKSFKF